MQAAPIRVLLVEDDQDDCLLIRDMLNEIKGRTFELDWANTYASGLDAILRTQHDIYLLDYRLGAATGLDLLRAAVAGGSTAPLILITGEGDESIDLDAMRAGAADYLMKGRFDAALLDRSIRYAIERKRSEEALRKAHEQLEDRVRDRTAELSEANRMLAEGDRRKDEFLAMLAHELRNPLAPIRNAIELMRLRGPDEPDLHWARDIIERQVQHMTRLVNDLLEVSRITRGKVTLQKEVLNVAAVIARAVETSRPHVEARRQHLTVSFPPDPVFLEGDMTRLAQILSNLLNNAAKYTPEEGQIQLTTRLEDAEIVFRVRDTGIGIPPEMLRRVFDLFIQVNQSLDRSQGGLGIGLTLVRSLVELHGGSVQVFSDGPGKGSEFVVRLPAVLNAVPDAAIANHRSDGERGPPRRRILVVDDNVDSAESLAMVLRVTGHQVRTAHDGLTALAMADEFEPEIVLLDIGLPQMDGYEVARRLRSRQRVDGLVIVALTGYGQDDDRRRSREAGFDHHLVKPVQPAVLKPLLGGERT